jgi:hypothetical protein
MSETMGQPSCVSASHAVLFESEEDRCTVCAALLTPDSDDEPSVRTDDDDDQDEVPSPSLPRGRGLLVWVRGDERRYEEPELCPRCASAIGITAVHRWEIEEDEG